MPELLTVPLTLIDPPVMMVEAAGVKAPIVIEAVPVEFNSKYNAVLL